ncbi:hypothetical protein AAF712_006239 [Marasmius tenuissimus]|uniref:Uncharacterized protein n=1 Tax=Marasmius tenuissimus TaxID=585030 RepID=A0ABR2ZZ37_9AGAR
MGLTAEDIVAVYTTATGTVISPIASLSLSFFVYGMYIIIFGSALRVLHKRRSSEHPLSALYYWWTISLFVLATTYVALICWLYVNQAVIYFTAAKTRAFERFLQYLKDDKPKTAVL